MKPLKAVIFDFDGTLIDNFKAIYNGYCHVQKHFGRKAVSFDDLKKIIGGSMEVTLKKILKKEDIIEDIAVYRSYYNDHMMDGLTLLPGALDILEALNEKNIHLAILTNKYGYATRLICEKLNIYPYFKHIIGVGDTPYKKPEYALTKHAIDTLQVDPQECIFIGDSPFDKASAECANIHCHLVATGSHSKKELELIHSNVYTDLFDLGKNVFGLTF